MNRFIPRTTKWSPRSSALLLAPKKSEPPRGSVSASADTSRPLEHGRQVPLLLLVRAKDRERLADDRRHDERAAGGHPEAADLLHRGALRHPAHALPAIRRREAEPEQAEPRVGFVELARVADLVAVHGPSAGGTRVDGGPDELAGAVPDCPRRLVQHEVVYRLSLGPGRVSARTPRGTRSTRSRPSCRR